MGCETVYFPPRFTSYVFILLWEERFLSGVTFLLQHSLLGAVLGLEKGGGVLTTFPPPIFHKLLKQFEPPFWFEIF